MESFLSRFKNPLVLIALLLAQTIGLATQVRRVQDASRPDGDQVRLVRLWVDAVISPFERAMTYSGQGIRKSWARYGDFRHVQDENAELKKQVDELKLERAELADDAVQAQKLRALLDFRQGYLQRTVAAQVIGTSGSDQSRLLILDKGSKDGLRPGMPVITPDGAVGKLRDVFGGTSQLLLLTDPTSGAGALLATTRIRAIVKGSATGKLVIMNLTPDERIKAGERVLTSGGDQVYPRGIPVGTIESVVPDPEHQPYTMITLKPAAKLDQLETVLVVTDMSDHLDTKSEEELVKESQIHAADVSRLPSLHEGKGEETGAPGTDSAMPPPADSRDLVPKPKPVLHPDKYTMGTVPPASELVPGGGKSVEPAAPLNPANPPVPPKE
jgi:rod shape-determining protein MreC